MNHKNQTDERILRKVQRQPNSIRGVGLFVSKKGGKLSKRIVPRLTYNEAIHLGDSSIAFKFIPYGENVRIDDEVYRLISIRSIPKARWLCIGKCTNDKDCRHISEVCICAEGECL